MLNNKLKGKKFSIFYDDYKVDLIKNELHLACLNEDKDEVINLLRNGIEVNEQESIYGMSALHCACCIFARDIDIIKILLEYGANPNIIDNLGFTALHLAVNSNFVEAVRVILEGSDLVDINIQDTYYKRTLLHIAKKEEIYFLLLNNRGINIELEDINGYRPLHHACIEGLKDKVYLLLKKGALVNALCKNEYIALHYACDNQYSNNPEIIIEIIKLLLYYGSDINANNNINMVSPLFLASDIIIVKYLIENGANIEAKDINGRTPLLSVCYASINIKKTKMLLDKGADIKTRDKNNNTIIHMLFKVSNKDIYYIKSLIELFMLYDLDKEYINVQDNKGDTPLHLVCKYINYSNYLTKEGIIKFLLLLDADISIKNKEGLTPLEYYEKSNKKYVNDLYYLIEEKRDWMKQYDKMKLLSCKCDLCKFNSSKSNTYLYDIEIKRYLKNINEANNKLKKIKTLFKEYNELKDIGSKLQLVCMLGGDLKIVKNTLKKEEINYKDNKGRTALHYACLYAIDEVVEYLLIQGINEDIKDKDGNTAYMYLKYREEYIKNKMIKIFNFNKYILNLINSGKKINTEVGLLLYEMLLTGN
jgi:ankyrin repeat protein